MWVWPKAREREAGKQGSREVELEEREREKKWEKEETCGPSNGNKHGNHT